MRWWIGIVAALFAVGMAGCGGEGVPSPHQTMSMTMTEANNQSTVTLQNGSQLVVRLVAQPGTGYLYKVVTNDSSLLQPMGDPSIEPVDPNSPPLPGGKEVMVFQFKAVKAGTDTLELRSLRFDGTESTVYLPFHVTIQVVPVG